MELVFKENTHEYYFGDKKLISVTQLMQKHGLAPNYDEVPSEVLKAKAERGSLIHKEIEEYLKTGEIGFTKELANFIKQPKGEVLRSEFKVHNDIIAGTGDLLLYENGVYTVADIKTTASLHKDAISWQLSIYAYLLNAINETVHVTKGQAFHFDKEGNLKVIDIPLKPFDEVDRLIECERQGFIYKQELIVKEWQLNKLYELETLISSIEKQKKSAEEQATMLRAALMEAMEKHGITSFENDNLKLTIKQAYERTSIDSAKLKKEMPAVAEQYTKKTTVKPSLIITLKGE